MLSFGVGRGAVTEGWGFQVRRGRSAGKRVSVFVTGRVRWSGVFSRYQRAKWCHQDDDRYRY